MLVSLFTVTLLAGTVPKKTLVAVINAEPVIVTLVPPPVPPEVVPRELTEGADAVLYVY
jgi:hypothetical protein